MWTWNERELNLRVENALRVGHGDLSDTSGTVPVATRFAATDGDAQMFSRYPMPLLALGDGDVVPGFRRVDAGGRSYLVARQEIGDLMLYANRCKHRGAELKCEIGAKRAICPYHGWSYGTDGTLRGIYGRDHGIAGDLKLDMLPSAASGGFLWRTAASTPDLDGLSQFHGWSEPRVIRQFHLDGAFHWTIGVDAFLETYHFASAHQATLGSLTVKNVALYDPSAEALRFTVPWRRPSTVGEDVRAYCHFMYFFFPNTFFLVFEDHFGWLSIDPTGTSTTRLTYRGLSRDRQPTPELVQKIEGSVAFLEGVKREDVAICESIQRGLALDQTHWTTRYEPGIAWFHGMLRAARQ